MLPLTLHELKYYFKNKSEVIQFIGLLLSVILLIPFGQSATGFNYQSLAAGIVWIALTVAISLGGQSLFQRDYNSGKLEAYQTSNLSLEVIILGKWLAYIIAILIPTAIILPAILIMLHVPATDWAHYYIGIGSGALGLTLITALASALMAGAQRAGALLGLMVLPLAIPVIIFGSHYLATPAALIQPSLMFLWGFAAFMLPVLCLTGASCIRASN